MKYIGCSCEYIVCQQPVGIRQSSWGGMMNNTIYQKAPCVGAMACPRPPRKQKSIFKNTSVGLGQRWSKMQSQSPLFYCHCEERFSAMWQFPTTKNKSLPNNHTNHKNQKNHSSDNHNFPPCTLSFQIGVNNCHDLSGRG